MRVGFDLDGVLYDFGASVRRYLDSIGRPYEWKAGADEPHTWNFFEHWGMDAKEFVQICNDGADAGYIFCGPARKHAVESVYRVKALGHQVIIITDRAFGSSPKVSHRNTFEWLKQHNIHFDELYFSADKTISPTDMFVEDKLENYDALEAAGVDAYLITKPWNQVKGGDSRQRILDVLDYAKIVDDKYSENLLVL